MRTKLSKTFVVTILSAFLFALPVRAVTISPSSGTVAANSSQNLAIVASPPSGSTAVQVRLTVTGATVTNYIEPTSSSWLSLGACGGSSTYNSTQICIDLSKTNGGTIANGESLGTFTLQIPASGTVTITKGSENAYLVGSTLQYSPGTAATYSIGATSNLPNTGLFDNSNPIAVGGALVATGSVLVIYVRLSKKFTKKLN